MRLNHPDLFFAFPNMRPQVISCQLELLPCPDITIIQLLNFSPIAGCSKVTQSHWYTSILVF